MTIQNNIKDTVLSDFMIVHENLITDKHLYRAMYIKKFADEERVDYWPVFRPDRNKREESDIFENKKDLFTIKFIVKEKGVTKCLQSR